MPRYDYACLDCETAAKTRLNRELVPEDFEDLVLFETSHSMNPTKSELAEAKTCPRCGGTNCEIYYGNNNVTGYIRGNGYLDRDGVNRDMNTHVLVNNDPYAPYRQPGEVDDLKNRLKRAGQHNPKTKYFNTTDT